MMKESWKSAGLGGAVIVLLTVLAYMPALNAGFVFDDSENLVSNLSLHTIEGLKRIWVDPHASYQYYPLTYTSFWAEYHLWGLRPAGYHAVNILLHASNAFLVGLLLARLAVPGAWLAALLFALHPVHVESVAWVSERKNVLSAFFYLYSLLTYLRFMDGPKRRARVYALSFVLFLCALLSKTSAVSMPFAVLLVLWWKQGRVKARDALALIPFFLAGAALGLLTAWVEIHYAGAHGPEWRLSMLERCLVAGRVVWFYAGKLLWPHPLMMVYPRWQINIMAWWQYLFPCAAVAVIVALWLCRHRLGKAPVVAVLFFAGSLAPIPAFINIAFMRHSYVADHWQYLPSIGLTALAAAVGERIWRRMREPRRYLGMVAGLGVLTALGVVTWRQSGVYRTDETLWRDTLAKNPNASLAHNNLGKLLHDRGNISEAIGHYEQALRIKPDFAEAHANLGNALLGLGKVAEAMQQCEQALRIEPNHPVVRYNLGNVLLRSHRVTEAKEQYEQALRIKPDFPEAHNNLGNILAGQGHVSEAVGEYTAALRINPDYPEAHNNLGAALASQGKIAEAIGEYRGSLAINPDNAEAHNNLANALIRQDRFAEAVAQCLAALRVKPDFTEAHYNLGNALAGQGMISEAMAAYREVLRLRPDWPPALTRLAWILATDANATFRNAAEAVQLAERLCAVTGSQQTDALEVLAAAYAEGGRFGDAVQAAQRAIELAKANGQQELEAELQKQLQLYQADRPFHRGMALTARQP